MNDRENSVKHGKGEGLPLKPAGLQTSSFIDIHATMSFRSMLAVALTAIQQCQSNIKWSYKNFIL